MRRRVTQGVYDLLRRRLPTRSLHHIMRFNYKANACSHLLLHSFHPRRLLLGSLYRRVHRDYESVLGRQISFLPKSTRTLSFPRKARLVASYSILR